MKAIKSLMIISIKAYQRFVSPFTGRNCRFHPTCSEYMKESIIKKGILLGTIKGLYRIIRCNPFSAGGYDPVK